MLHLMVKELLDSQTSYILDHPPENSEKTAAQSQSPSRSSNLLTPAYENLKF